MAQPGGALLEWEWVAGGEIRLPDWICKTRKGRKVPLIAALAAVIDRRRLSRAYVDRQGVVQRSKYVFHFQGKRLQDDTLNEFFRRAIQAAPAVRDEVRHFYFHDLRRCAVRNLIRAGVDRKVAKTITGHLSDKIFDDYNITSGKDQKHALVRSAKYTRGRRLYGEDYDEDNPRTSFRTATRTIGARGDGKRLKIKAFVGTADDRADNA